MSLTTQSADDQPVYKFLVIDSGPIIKLTSIGTLWKRTQELYTVPAVLEEIRDAKARQHLQQLPMPLQTRTPSAHAMHVVSEFSKQTGDYQSLSTTDIQVMALVYDLEQEACGGDMQHIRTTPKRVVGLGPLKNLGNGTKQNQASNLEVTAEMQNAQEGEEDDGDEESDSDSSDEDDESDGEEPSSTDPSTAETVSGPKSFSWAKVVNPAASSQIPIAVPANDDNQLQVPLGKLSLRDDATGSQFDDADEDPLPVPFLRKEEDSGHVVSVEQELELEFPSLAAAATVPMENEDETAFADNESLLEQQLRLEEERKKEALKPLSKSGKTYNSFRKYSDLMKPKPKAAKPAEPTDLSGTFEQPISSHKEAPVEDAHAMYENSRIVGGSAFAGQDDDVEDDGEGWITTSAEISTMKAAGILDPTRSGSSKDNANSKQLIGPPPSERAACATTDFAMQNVLLQMNMELLSVDGMKVRKLKSWVTRCGSCYKIFTSTDNLGPLKSKRLFCSHCGSDFLQRIACSVDGKTGRLKLHFSKRYKNNLRGTKFSLPKPSSGNRFQGDLLLREDQLLVGAWNQKVKMLSGGKSRDAAQSIFGKDIATNVGCKASAASGDDIRVGFGRRNPNAAKGRERRGKKKKTTEKACGLRRY